MPTQVNRTTFQILRSASGSAIQFPPAEWIKYTTAASEVNLNALIGTGKDVEPEIPKIYWVAEATDVREMTQPEKDVADSDPGVLATARAEKRFELQTLTTQFIQQRYNPAVQQSFALLAHQLIGVPRARAEEFFAWHETVQESLSLALDAVDVAATVPVVEVVSIDFGTLSGTNPEVTLQYIYNG